VADRAPKGIAGQGPLRRKVIAGGAASAPLSPEQEAVALQFVREHHPELAELLAALKPSNPAQYAQAMQDLFRASERIHQARPRDPRRFELELQLWKTQSRRDLVAVRLRMARTPELESQLRQLIQEHLDLQQSLLRLERDRVAERLRKLDEQLARDNRDEQVEQQFQQLVSRPRTVAKTPSKTPIKASSKTPSKPTPKSAAQGPQTTTEKPTEKPSEKPTDTTATKSTDATAIKPAPVPSPP
jgi:hypothetical protein